MAGNKLAARRAGLESLGSLDVSTKRAWCARHWDGKSRVAFAGWPFNLPSHHMYCDLLLGSPAVILPGDKEQAAREQQLG